jgi:hypothetical protein
MSDLAISNVYHKTRYIELAHWILKLTNKLTYRLNILGQVDILLHFVQAFEDLPVKYKIIIEFPFMKMSPVCF